MKKILSFLFILTFTLISTAAFSAISESRLVGGKIVGKGGAITADNMGISSLFFNPAALSDMKSNLEVWASFGAPYEGVEGFNLHEGAVSVGYNLMGTLPIALGVKSSGDFQNLSWNIVYLGTGKKFLFSDGILNSVSVGFSGKLINAHVANIPANITYVSPNGFGFALDLGLQVALFQNRLNVGLTGRNLYSTAISVVDGGVGEPLQANLFAGLKYQITENLNMTLDYAFLNPEHVISPINLFGDSFSMANLFIGLEYSYMERIMIYTGFNEGALSLGVAVTEGKYLSADFGLLIVPGLKMYSQVGVSFRPF